MVKVPFGVLLMTKMSSSFPVSALIYTKNSVSSTVPLNSQQNSSVSNWVGMIANASFFISKFGFRFCLACSFVIFISGMFLS